MEKQQPKCFAILKASQVSINQLPEEIREKIEILNAVLESRNSISDNDERELRDWALKVDARDDAVISDLQGFIAKRKKEQNADKKEEPDGDEKQYTPQQMRWGGRIVLENKPKWMFW